MFNVIPGKYMAFVYQALAVTVILTQTVVLVYTGDNKLYSILVLTLISLPYFLASWRSRDFKQVDAICGVFAIVAFCINFVIYVSNKSTIVYYLGNIIVALIGVFLHSMVYAIVFKYSEAVSEFRRYSACESSISAYHFIVLAVLVIVTCNVLKPGSNILYLLLTICTIWHIVRKFVIFIITYVLK